MNLYFPKNDPIERARLERSDASIPRLGIFVRPLQESSSRSNHPLHPRLIGSGAMLLIAAFATDVIYAKTLLFQWDNFSVWLLTCGLLLAAFAGVALVLDILLHRVARIDWERFAGFAVAALLSLLNAFVHSRDAYTAVVPQGIVLSASVAILLVFIGWWGWSVSAPSSH
jgi:uncharacterized membrane protein